MILYCVDSNKTLTEKEIDSLNPLLLQKPLIFEFPDDNLNDMEAAESLPDLFSTISFLLMLISFFLTFSLSYSLSPQKGLL